MSARVMATPARAYYARLHRRYVYGCLLRLPFRLGWWLLRRLARLAGCALVGACMMALFLLFFAGLGW